MRGPLVGAFTLHGVGDLTKQVAGGIPGIDLAVYGAVLILVVAFAPGGVLGLIHRLLSGLTRPRPAKEAQ